MGNVNQKINLKYFVKHYVVMAYLNGVTGVPQERFAFSGVWYLILNFLFSD
jgi:hypothetical protein